MVRMSIIPSSQESKFRSRGEPAYFCCACGYGPQIYSLHPACSYCGAHACGNCTGATISHQGIIQEDQDKKKGLEARFPDDVQRLASGGNESEEDPHPKDPYGAALSSPRYPTPAMLSRYLGDEPGVCERLAYGIKESGVAESEAELGQMLRRFGYLAEEEADKLK